MKEKDPLLQVLTSPMSDQIDQPILHDEVEQEDETDFTIIFGKKREMSDTYKVTLAKKAAKNPNAVEVQTEEGWMTVKEAIEKGYNPKTGKFDESKLEKMDMGKYFPHRGKPEREKFARKGEPRGTNVNKKQMESMGQKSEEHPDFMPGNQPREGGDFNKYEQGSGNRFDKGDSNKETGGADPLMALLQGGNS